MTKEPEFAHASGAGAAAESVQSLVRLLYTQNPFYLIGTLLILVGLQQGLGKEPGLATSGLLAVGLAGFTLLLAAIAAVIIRYGKVWDDARTILLVIVLMFFMLSSSLDVLLLTQPLAGSLVLAAGLTFSIGLSQTLLAGLQIHLAPRYRRPYYLMLALLFGWPVVLVWINQFGLAAARPWAVLGFPVLAALSLLTLLPAAATRRRHEPASGTPWIWPFYPWSLFVFLTVGFAIRSWWLTISFEPVQGQDAYFRPYFLFPLVLAWSALVLEMGKARHRAGAIAAGLLLPAAGMLLVFPGAGRSPVEVAFLGRLTHTLAAPAQLAIWSLIGFYLWAWLRNVRAAEGFALVAGLAAAVIGRQTLDLESLTRPQPLVLAAVAGTLLVLAIQRQSTWRAVAVGAMAAFAFRFTGGGSWEAAWFWQWHAPLIGLVAVAAVLNDEFARFLRELAWRAAPALAAFAAVAYPWILPAVNPMSLAVYLVLLLLASVALWRRQKEVPLLAAAIVTLAANLLVLARQVYGLLDRTQLADGLPFLAWGLAATTIALVISLLKMGLWPWTQTCLARLNFALGGKEAPG
ncbi:MAG TPA: hypothetical protein VFV87_08360 [Pirellulaceae bacterium]|nr:hypothetical protein [Pirellulaceae bacterium]